MNKLYNFTVGMCGYGDTPEEAWEDCQENFDVHREPLPEYEEENEVDDN